MFREIASAAGERSYAYRSLTPYTWTLLALVALYVLGIIGAFIAGFVSGIVSGGASPELISIVSVGVSGIYVLCMIAGGFWIYNAACNVRALGGRGFQVTPGWAVGFYAIPIAAWFKPFEGMDEIERASRAPESWRTQPTRIVLRIWWGAWIITGIGGAVVRLTERFAADAIDTGTLGLIGYASLGLTVTGLAASILFFVIVLGIHRAQAETRARGSNLAQVFA
jgi:hypothetical protein